MIGCVMHAQIRISEAIDDRTKIRAADLTERQHVKANLLANYPQLRNDEFNIPFGCPHSRDWRR